MIFKYKHVYLTEAPRTKAKSADINRTAIGDIDAVNIDDSIHADNEIDQDSKIDAAFNALRNKNKLQVIKPIIAASIQSFGTDARKNKFLDFVSKIRFNILPAQYDNFNTLFERSGNGNGPLHVTQPVYLNKSLYDRSNKDFIYSANAFEMVSDPAQVKKYFVDTSDITSDKFYTVGGKVKPAGGEGIKGDTIWNTIEAWGADGNDKGEQENLVTLRKLLVDDGISKNEFPVELTQLIKDNYDSVTPKPKLPKETYISKVGIMGAGSDIASKEQQRDYIRMLSERKYPEDAEPETIVKIMCAFLDTVTSI